MYSSWKLLLQSSFSSSSANSWNSKRAKPLENPNLHETSYQEVDLSKPRTPLITIYQIKKFKTIYQLDSGFGPLGTSWAAPRNCRSEYGFRLEEAETEERRWWDAFTLKLVSFSWLCGDDSCNKIRDPSQCRINLPFDESGKLVFIKNRKRMVSEKEWNLLLVFAMKMWRIRRRTHIPQY